MTTTQLQPHLVNGAFNELARKADGSDKKLMIKETVERAQKQWAAYQQQEEQYQQQLLLANNNDSNSTSPPNGGPIFPAQLIFHALLLGLHTKKPKLCTSCLTGIRHLVCVKKLPATASFDAISGSSANLGGKTILWATLELVCDVIGLQETEVKFSVLSVLEEIVKDDTLPLTHALILKPFKAAFNAHLTTIDTQLKDKSFAFLQNITKRVLRGFTSKDRCPPDAPVEPPPTFSCETELPWMAGSSVGALNLELEPTDFFRVELPFAPNAKRISEHSALLTNCDTPTKDLVTVFRLFCAVATKPLPSTASSAQNIEVKTRECALRLLCFFLKEFPTETHLTSKLHYDSTWTVIQLLKKDIFSAIGFNLCTVAPNSFFTFAIDATREICLKWHYFLQTELYVFFTQTLFPLAKHKFSNFQHKALILGLVRSVFADPATVVAFFINYDCNTEFANVQELNGMLQPMSTFVAELMYLNFEGKGGMLSRDQQRLLREQCVQTMHTFADSVLRWISESPQKVTSIGGTMTSCLSDEEDDDGSSLDGGDSSFGASLGGGQVRGAAASAGDTQGGKAGRSGAVNELVQNWQDSAEVGDSDPTALAPQGTVTNLGGGVSPNTYNLNSGREVGASGSPSNPSLGAAPSLGGPQGHHKRTESATSWKSANMLNQNPSFYSDPGGLGSQSTGGGLGGRMSTGRRSRWSYHTGSRAAAHGSSSRLANHADYFDPGYHWTHIHQMFINKKITGTAIHRFNTNWRHGRTYLVDKKVLDSGKNHLQLAEWMRRTGGIQKDQVCKIFERILKEEECHEIFKAYIGTLNYRDVPVDIAFRDTTIEFSSFEGGRVNFEAQVWEKIQSSFGTEYALQNDYRLSANDAEVLCGCILFLHTSLHNNKVGSKDRMGEAAFVSLASECVKGAIPDNDLALMYRRVEDKRWGPEVNLKSTVGSFRDPRKQLQPEGLTAVASSTTAGGGADDNKVGIPRKQLIAPSEPVQIPLGRAQGELLSNMPQYANNMSNLSAEQVAQLQFLRVVNDRLRRFEEELSAVSKQRTRVLTPLYIPPVFAQHAKLILLRFFPHWVAAAYLGLRQKHHTLPCLQMIEEMYQSAFDVAAAFGLRLSEQYAVAEKLIQECLRQPGSLVLSEEQPHGPSSTLGLYLLRKA